MTGLPAHSLSPDERVAGIPAEEINAALPDEEIPEKWKNRQSRLGEEHPPSVSAQIRAIPASDLFWHLCDVFPNNKIAFKIEDEHGNRLPDEAQPVLGEGRPTHFPDYLKFFLICVAGIPGIANYRRAAAEFEDIDSWARLVHYMDQYVPEGYTKLSDLPYRQRNTDAKKRAAGIQPRAKANAQNALTSTAEPRPTTTGEPVQHLHPVPQSNPPRAWTLDYFLKTLRGFDYKGQPLVPGDPYYGILDKLMTAFRTAGMSQAQAMGVLLPDSPFVYRAPDPNQWLGADGVVLPVADTRKKGTPNPTADLYTVAGGSAKAYGSKWVPISIRLRGQAHSRVIVYFAHVHKNYPGSARTESDVVLAIAPALRDLSRDPEGKVPGYGMKGILVDSAVRGEAVVTLQRNDITVVNYPHAESNPDRGPGNRLNPRRREKSRLRTVATHRDALGQTCEHYIYAYGGSLVQLVANAEGTDQMDPLKVLAYDKVRERTGARAEYLTVQVRCTTGGEDFTHRVPLFHTNPMSSDPTGPWGEVCRVYPPGSKEFKYLYGGRNDTEARHYDLKRRLKHLPRDVNGQQVRLLGAAVASNSLAWQVHLQVTARGNVFDNTA